MPSKRYWLSTRSDSPAYLDGYLGPIEACKGISVEGLAVGQFLVAQHADGDGLAELKRFGIVGTPMHTGDIAADRDIRGQLVQLAADGHAAGIGASVWDQRGSIARGGHVICNC